MYQMGDDVQDLLILSSISYLQKSEQQKVKNVVIVELIELIRPMWHHATHGIQWLIVHYCNYTNVVTK